jgi:hypothetical protein
MLALTNVLISMWSSSPLTSVPSCMSLAVGSKLWSFRLPCVLTDQCHLCTDSRNGAPACSSISPQEHPALLNTLGPQSYRQGQGQGRQHHTAWVCLCTTEGRHQRALGQG